jgi:hypothetical protein
MEESWGWQQYKTRKKAVNENGEKGIEFAGGGDRNRTDE